VTDRLSIMMKRLLVAHIRAVRRAPVVWINQTYTNAFVEKALQKVRQG